MIAYIPKRLLTQSKFFNLLPNHLKVNENVISKNAPGVTRTRGTQIRNLVLYPPELRGHMKRPKAKGLRRRESLLVPFGAFLN
jgi:hypothetical protein